jgi:hypothetical protein
MIINVLPPPARSDPRLPGYVTADGQLIFQRRGTSSTYQLATIEHWIQVEATRAPSTSRRPRRPKDPPPAPVYTLTSRRTRQDPVHSIHPTREAAFHAAAAILLADTGADYVVADFIGAYAHAFSDPEDRIVAPLHYDPAADLIRTAAGNRPVIRFNPDAAWRPTIAVGLDPLHHAAATKALEGGIHDCDRRRGDDHCKARLAWLAGAYLLGSATASTVCAVLDNTMRLERAPATAA